MLLSDKNVIDLLNSRFVPVWESVRPVPQVTIDFGDGRVLKRTLAGNTVMSVLLPDGRMVDALPGVYTPRDFLAEVGETLSFLDQSHACGPAEPDAAAVAAWHKARVNLAVFKEQMRITLSKRVVESPLLQALGVPRRVVVQPANGPAGAAKIPDAITDPKDALERVTQRIEDVSHEPSSAERIRKSYDTKPEAQRPTPEQLGKLAVDADSAANIALVRPAVHLFFTAEGALPAVRPARDAIYRRILHVPVDDPNLGLADSLPPGTSGAR